MSERVVLVLESNWKEYAPDIGVFITSFLELKTDRPAHGIYRRERGKVNYFIIYETAEEADQAYDLLKYEQGAGVFSKIYRINSYRTDGHDIAEGNKRAHANHCRLIRAWVRYALNTPPPRGSVPVSCKLSYAIKMIAS